MLTAVDICQQLIDLSASRPIFHSEADFQHALAWQIQNAHPQAKIRLEMPVQVKQGRAALDLLVVLPDRSIAIELKYFKARIDTDWDGERFQLPATVARDICRYDACNDIQRLERLVGSGQADEGWLIVLTNDPSFWREQVCSSIDQDFKLHDGRALSGVLTWAEHAGAGTTRRREQPIELVGKYRLSWKDFSDLRGAGMTTFRFLAVKITEGPKGIHADQGVEPRRTAMSRRPGKHEALRSLFDGRKDQEFELSFREIEAIVGRLPDSARVHIPWWHHLPSHPQAVWEAYGFKATPDLKGKKVLFVRQR